MTGLPETVQTEFAKAIRSTPTDLRITLRKPLAIQSNCLYDIWSGEEHFIAKLYLKTDELEAAPRREFQALTLLSSLDMAPQPVYYEPAIAPLVIYRYMQGEMWGRRCVNAADLSGLKDVWLKLHGVPVDWYSRGSERSLPEIEAELRQHFRNYLEWAALEFKPARQPAEMILNLLESRTFVARELADYPPLFRFCRSDPRFANVIQRPNGRLGMVDWEDSGLRDPARELADLITHPDQEDLMGWLDWQSLLIPYLGVLGEQDPTIARRMNLYLEIFPFFWMMIIMKRGMRLASSGQLAGWMINDLPGNVRLRRYLARVIAWPQFDHENVFKNLESIQFFSA